MKMTDTYPIVNRLGGRRARLEQIKKPISFDEFVEKASAKPRDANEDSEIFGLVRATLGNLPLHEREALEALVRISGHSCRTVARRRGVSTQTVCNWAKAAKARLRPQLEGCL